MFISSKLKIGDETLAIREYPAPSNKTFVLVHGAGSAHQATLQPVAEYIQACGFRCISFDFSGHGESSHHQLSSIQIKTQQLNTVLQHYGTEKVYLMGFSMGGQICVNVLHHHHIQGLILCSPALYHVDAFDVPFDERFSRLIRVKDSWKQHNAKRQFDNFSGKLALIRAKQDDVIPQAVFEIYQQSVAPSHVQEWVIDDANHFLGAWFEQHPLRFAQLFDDVRRFLVV